MAWTRWRILLALTAGQFVLFAATAFLDGFGARGWHNVASLAIVIALSVRFRRPLAGSRRVLAIGVLVTTLLATVSGFWLLYWKEGIRAAGYQDWGVFWHVAWSWAASVFFFQHTWINRIAFAHFMRRSFDRAESALVHGGLYALLVIAFVVTWSGIGKGWFTVESYIPLSLYAWLLATAPPYLVWGWVILLRARVGASRLDRARVRGPVDVALVPAAALATLSGVALTWFDPFMDANGWKYVSKFWHVWPSVLFTVLVFAHSLHVWNTMRAHWRQFGVAVGEVPRPTPAVRPQKAGPTVRS